MEPKCQGPAPRGWIKKQIRECGVAVISVFPGADDPPGTNWFHYTVGLRGAGLPELLTIGPDQRIGPSLTKLATILRERKAPSQTASW